MKIETRRVVLKDYYQILGVDRLASDDEIKRAFRKLVVAYHPDKNPAPQAEEVILEINEAYEILGDGEKRTLYDNLLSGRTVVERARPYHRDPRYRRRTPDPNYKSKTQQTLEMMQNYLPHALFISRCALAFCVFMALDFFFPASEEKEIITQMKTKQYGLRMGSDRQIVTNKNNVFKLNLEDMENFSQGMEILVTYSSWMRVTLSVENPETHFEAKVPATIYANFSFVPLVLLLTSLLGAFYKKGIEFRFNLGIVNLLMLMLSILFIFIPHLHL